MFHFVEVFIPKQGILVRYSKTWAVDASRHGPILFIRKHFDAMSNRLGKLLEIRNK